jgi:dipeptidyl aminopeptidase/acylaminoacyl peptidase
MLTYERQETGYASSTMRYWKEFMGVASGMDLKAISPADLAEHADAPILLIHGKDDTVVPIEQSELMERNLKHAGKPVDLITLPGADHWLLEEPARIAMVKASVEFVMKNNPPDPAPAAVAAK